MNLQRMSKSFRMIFLLLVVSLAFNFGPEKASAQIWEPEGLNLPGLWNGWTNPPTNSLALASYTQVPGGKVTKITSGTTRWQTIIKVAPTGGDVVGGSYPFLFTSGPTASPWQNTWKDITVVMNTLQDYTYNGAADNQITVLDGRWYTVNWQDAGYNPTKAIFMETSGDPVSITGVTQSPLPGQVLPGQNVTVSVTLSNTPSAEELFYVRYSNNGFVTSTLVPVTVTGTTGTAIILPTTGNVSYYVFSTTVANPTSDYYMYAIKVNNNGGANYSFSYNTANVNVTFKVDMSYQTVSPDGVHLVGDFQGWNSTATPMTSIGGGVYSVTLPIQSGGYQQYKFLNGNTFSGEETVPAACGAAGGSGGFNRFFTVPAADTVFGAVCFSSCVPCSSLVPVVFKVDMSQQVVSPDGVHLAGDFQGWNPGSTSMTLSTGNVYTANAYLENNSYHEYKFINGNSWAGEESVPADCGVDNGAGGYNRFFTVSSSNPVLNTVCFSSCNPCGDLVPVTFWVDMSQQAVSANGVHLVGNFQGWDPAATPMALASDDVYYVTVNLQGNSSYEYKYVNGDNWDGAEIVPAECGVDNGSGGYNRFLELEETGASLPEVCFSLCEDCPPPPNPIDVTFRVDMSNETVSPDGVHLVGDFQGWDTDSTAMINTGGGIYVVTVTLDEGSSHQYKFINGNTWEGEEVVPAECGVDNGTGGYNRFINLLVNDTTLTAVCFGSCEPCGTPPSTSLVTFKVDMQDELVSPDGVHIAGNFQGWDPASTAMVNTGGTIYEYSALLNEGFQVQYKFINGITWDDAESVPQECGIDDGNGGFNRFFTVPVDDTLTDKVCFSKCDICHVGIDEKPLSFFLIGNPIPNPSHGIISVDCWLKSPATVETSFFNKLGIRVLPSVNRDLLAGQQQLIYNLETLSPGTYILRLLITVENQSFNHSVIVIRK